jgi:predicted GIY-YIG superfamily endonuclease
MSKTEKNRHIQIEMDYSNGKLYRLVCDDGHFYIGSTTTTLCKRLHEHKKASRHQKKVSSRVYKHINTVGWDNVRIVLIEEVQCANKNELCREENKYIEKELQNPLCLNTNRSVQNSLVAKRMAVENVRRWRKNNLDYSKAKAKERYKQNKDAIAARQKANREANKEKVAAHKSEKVECDVCNALISRSNLNRHRRNAHQSALATASDG